METQSASNLTQQRSGSSPTRAVVSLLLAAGLGAGIAWVGLMVLEPFDESAAVSVEAISAGQSDKVATRRAFIETTSMEPIMGSAVPPDAAVVPAPAGSRLLMCSPGQGGHVISYLPNPGVFISVADWAEQLQRAGWQPVPRRQVAVVWVESET